MKLNNKYELSQLQFDIDSLTTIVLELTEKKPSTEIRENQNIDNLPVFIGSIRQRMMNIEGDLIG